MERDGAEMERRLRQMEATARRSQRALKVPHMELGGIGGRLEAITSR